MTPQPKVTLHGTSCAELVVSAIKSLNDRKGSSSGAILKFIIDHQKLKDSSTVHASVNYAIREALAAGVLIRKSGSHGAIGKFRLAPKSKPADDGDVVQHKTAKSPKKAPATVKSPKRTSAGGSDKKLTAVKGGSVKKTTAANGTVKKSTAANGTVKKSTTAKGSTKKTTAAKNDVKKSTTAKDDVKKASVKKSSAKSDITPKKAAGKKKTATKKTT